MDNLKSANETTTPSTSSAVGRTIDQRLSSREDEKVALKDFFIEYSSDGGSRLDPGRLTLSVFGLEEEEEYMDAGRMENISPASWKYHRVIQLCPDIGDITFVAQSEEAGDLGFLFFTANELLAFLSVEYDIKLDRNFTMEEGVPGLLKMSFSISTVSRFQSSVSNQQLSKIQAVLGNLFERPTSLNSLGNRFMQQFAMSNEIHDIDKAFSAYHRAVQVTKPDDARYAEYVCDAAYALFRRFGLTANQSDIDQAISMMEVGVACTPPGDVDLPGRLVNLGSLYRTRFEHHGEPRDIERGVEYQQKGLEIHPQKQPAWLSALAHSYRMWCECTGRSEDAEKSILYHQKALQFTPKGTPDFALRLSDLGTSCRIRFQHTKDGQHIEEAIRHQQMAIQCAADNNFIYPKLFNNLGNSFQSRFQAFQDMSDIDNALVNHRKAARLLPDDNTDLPSFLNNLSISLLMRFERHGDVEDVKNSISYLERAIERTQEGHPNRPGLLSNLGNSFLAQFRHTGNLQSVDSAIAHHDSAVQLTPSNHANLPGFLRNLGRSLAARYASTGDLLDINNALLHQERAVGLTPYGHANLPNQLSDLGTLFTYRFKRTGELEDIERAISHQERALELTSQHCIEMPVRLGELGASFRTRFEHFGDHVDIETAILHQQQAVQLTTKDHPDHPALLSSLASSFSVRFWRTEDLDDIGKAISYQQQAVEHMPADHAYLPLLRNNLGNAFLTRFKWTKDTSGGDLEHAISNHQMAVRHMPDTHVELPGLHNNLGSSFHTRFVQSQSLEDIESAIFNLQEAVRHTPKDGIYRSRWLSNLGNSFRDRFKHTKYLLDADSAISNQRMAVEMTVEGHAERPIRLYNLATSLHSRFDVTKDPEDLRESMNMACMAAKERSGHPNIRLAAARSWAELCQQKDCSSESMEAFQAALDLLSQVAGLEQTISRRHKNLVEVSDLTASATAAAIENKEVGIALAWLEQGRCLVWNQINQLRAPVDILRASDPTLADRFLHVAHALEASGHRHQQQYLEAITHETVAIQDEVRAHVQLANDWDQVLLDVRSVPGFQDFLQSPKIPNIFARLPQEGPIVIFNIAKTRCDALVLVSGRDELLHIQLKSFTYGQADQLSRDLRSFLQQKSVRLEVDSEEDISRAGRRAMSIEENMLYRILRTLWFDVVKPIFDALEYSCPPTDRPRIWWCPTGPLAFLPIHAAGVYGPEEDPGFSVPDFVISSYTPTVSVLLDKLQEVSEEKPTGASVLLISQPATPGCRPIPGVQAETEALNAMMEKRGIRPRVLENEAGTIDQVKKEMAAHGWVHFACHGVQNIVEPLSSGFHLHDGLLELRDIMPLRLANTEHAFLSACQTSTGDEKLSDEAVHLAAGMLAAGYRGVVATMWPIQDQYGPEIASKFYGHLLESGKFAKGVGRAQQLDGSGTARALDYSTRKIREKLGDGERALSAWLPYVHFGI